MGLEALLVAIDVPKLPGFRRFEIAGVGRDRLPISLQASFLGTARVTSKLSILSPEMRRAGFLIDGPNTNRDRFLAGAALNTALTERARRSLTWDAELADSDTAHALSLIYRSTG